MPWVPVLIMFPASVNFPLQHLSWTHRLSASGARQLGNVRSRGLGPPSFVTLPIWRSPPGNMLSTCETASPGSTPPTSSLTGLSQCQPLPTWPVQRRPGSGQHGGVPGKSVSLADPKRPCSALPAPSRRDHSDVSCHQSTHCLCLASHQLLPQLTPWLECPLPLATVCSKLPSQ